MSGLNFENTSTILNYDQSVNNILCENTSTILNYNIFDYGAEWQLFKILLDFMGFAEGSIDDIFLGGVNI